MIKRYIKHFFPRLVRLRRSLMVHLLSYDLELNEIIRQRQMNHLNPLSRCGKKCFSQNDEDGITLEILRRLGIQNGHFAEYGVGDGTENNSLVLIALGWKGFWVGGEKLLLDVSQSTALHYFREWVTGDNVASLFNAGLKALNVPQVDVVSLDLDGNDVYFCKGLLEAGARPSLFIVEYNAKFPPPIRFSINYDPLHEWQGDDYHGASLMSFVDLFRGFGYQLVCCNPASGSNAFFVRKEDMGHFEDIPQEPEFLYEPPHYFSRTHYGHATSIRTIEAILRPRIPK